MRIEGAKIRRKVIVEEYPRPTDLSPGDKSRLGALTQLLRMATKEARSLGQAERIHSSHSEGLSINGCMSRLGLPAWRSRSNAFAADPSTSAATFKSFPYCVDAQSIKCS